MAAKPVKILGIAGSFKKGSYNRAALRAAQTLVPENATLEIFDISEIPPFNQDQENNPPEVMIPTAADKFDDIKQKRRVNPNES